MTVDLAILYEHPQWFTPLFAALNRRGVAYKTLTPNTTFDPADPVPPAPAVLSRLPISALLRNAKHPIFWAQALIARWERFAAQMMGSTAVPHVAAV